jgi:MoaA/NifB/PqqE/SkfB family radical SAM enzyme
MKRNNWYYFYRYIKWKFGDRSPIVASLKVTQRCNLSCSHCSWKNKIVQDLPTQRWKEIIRDVHGRGCTQLTLEGGEPTLRTDLQELIEYASSLGLSTLVVTNGTRDLSKITPNRVWVSLEGPEKINDQIRGFGTFEKAFETIRRYPKKIVTLTTISRTNYKEIEEMCEALSDYVLGFMFSFLYPYKETRDIALTSSERKETAKQLLHLKARFNIVNSDSFLKAVGTGWKCYPWGLICATADGKFSDGCMVEHIEKCDCEMCDMACYGEMAQAIRLKMDALKFFYDAAGVPHY